MTNPQDVIKVLESKLLIDKKAVIVDLEKSQGSWIVDQKTNKHYLDCFSQFASQALGWNHPKMIAQKERLLEVAINRVANSDMYTTQFADFVKKFSEFTNDFNHHFYICGGAVAVENALKAAFDWKGKKLKVTTEYAYDHLQVIYLKEAFHGRTGYTLSLTNNNDLKNPKTYGFPKFKWKKIQNPKIWHELESIDDIKVKNLEKMSLNEAESYLKKGNVAAVILEPIQGEGGDNHFRKEYLKELRKLTYDYEAMLIFDEVQTGLGLTGKTWAYEHFDVIPDILCFGKKVQVCGICATDRIDEIKNNVFTEYSRINSTWGGNIVDMVRSTMQMEIIQEEDLIHNVSVVGSYFLEKIKSFYGKMSNIRGRGFMIAFDLNSKEERDSFLANLEEKGMLALPCGQKSVRLRPHLNFSRTEVDEAIKIISDCL